MAYECVILYRTHSGHIDFIRADGNELDISVFLNHDDAVAYAEQNSLLQAVPYQIVELDEL
jgi:hypothetical protein